MITIDLSEEEARLFRLFQEYYVQIKYLLDQNCFSVERGDVTIHFDRKGNISSIEKRLFSYPEVINT